MKLSPQLLLGISDLPRCPALYALYGGTGKRAYVAYVGIADSLKRRAAQHLLNRDSSVATGTSAVGINPDYVTEIRWWEYRGFSKRSTLEAAELVAFGVFDPALRSRKPVTKAALELYKSTGFKKKIEQLLKGNPSGHIHLPSLDKLARRLARTEERLDRIEDRLKSGRAAGTK